VGASAGGLAAVTDLLKHLPPGIGAAFVIIQHLDPRHESLTTGILSRVSPIPVKEVEDGRIDSLSVSSPRSAKKSWNQAVAFKWEIGN
jgi:chemotaxis response regulator CheB